MIVQQLTPLAQDIEVEAMLAGLMTAGSPLEPFCDEVIEFCHAYSRRLFTDWEAKRYPELQALAFWMRKSELLRMRTEFAALNLGPVRRVPRGLVFHIPPANVDTISIYSWLMAVLVGNRNIVRISPRASIQTRILVRLLDAELAIASPSLRHSTTVVSYGHEQEITGAICRLCDMRVIWGGDATVNAVRAIPMNAHGREIVFPDRHSLSAVHAGSFLEAAAASQADLASRFFNDVFWFDQMACSSPRIVVWCGESGECAEASSNLYKLVGEYAGSRGFAAEPATRISKFTFACRAILDSPVVSYVNYGHELDVVGLDNLSSFDRDHCGGGLLYNLSLPNLQELARFVERRDQTLTHFGFDASELERLVKTLNGRGIDRLVPVGHALSFSRYWDGMDLFQEMTRAVYIDAGTKSGNGK